jgi:hypothetical protein
MPPRDGSESGGFDGSDISSISLAPGEKLVTDGEFNPDEDTKPIVEAPSGKHFAKSSEAVTSPSVATPTTEAESSPPAPAQVDGAIDTSPAISDETGKEPVTRENVDVAWEAAHREKAARKSLDRQVEKASSKLAGTNEEEFDALIDKDALVSDARAKLDEAREVQRLAGDAASSAYLEDREAVTDKVRQGIKAIGELLAAPDGIVRVSALPGAPENTAVTIKELNRQISAEATPFHVEEKLDEQSGMVIRDMLFHTADPNVLVIEHWNKTTGNLIRVDYMKGEGLLAEVPPKADPTRIDRMNAWLARLEGIEESQEAPPAPELNANAKALAGDITPDQVRVSNAGGGGDSYINMADNLKLMGRAEELATLRPAEKAKPTQRKGFFATLFGRK